MAFSDLYRVRNVFNGIENDLEQNEQKDCGGNQMAENTMVHDLITKILDEPSTDCELDQVIDFHDRQPITFNSSGVKSSLSSTHYPFYYTGEENRTKQLPYCKNDYTNGFSPTSNTLNGLISSINNSSYSPPSNHTNNFSPHYNSVNQFSPSTSNGFSPNMNNEFNFLANYDVSPNMKTDWNEQNYLAQNMFKDNALAYSNGTQYPPPSKPPNYLQNPDSYNNDHINPLNFDLSTNSINSLSQNYGSNDFDINLLRLAAQEVSNSQNYNMNNKQDNMLSALGKMDFNSFPNNYSLDINHMLDPSVDYSYLNRSESRPINNSERSLTIPLLDLTERQLQMNNALANPPMRKIPNYPRTNGHQYNWSGGKYMDGMPLNVEIEPSKEMHHNKNPLNDSVNYQGMMGPNFGGNKLDPRMFSNPPPNMYGHENFDTKHSMQQEMNGNDIHRQPPPPFNDNNNMGMFSEETLRQFANQQRMMAVPLRAISKGSHCDNYSGTGYNNMNGYKPQNYGHQMMNKNPEQKYEADNVPMNYQREKMFRNLEHANYLNHIPRPIFPRNMDLVRMQKDFQDNLRIGFHSMNGLPLAPMNISPMSNLNNIPVALLEWFPHISFRNYRRCDPAGILHFRLEMCQEQWKLLEMERKKTEADLAIAFPGRMMSSANSLPVPRTNLAASRAERLTVDMLREHSKVITLMGKMEQIRACAASKKKSLSEAAEGTPESSHSSAEQGKSATVTKILKNNDRHNPVLSTGNKLAALSAGSGGGQSKNIETNGDMKSPVTVLKRGETLAESNDSSGDSSCEDSDDEENLEKLVGSIKVSTHPEIEEAILAWRAAVDLVKDTRDREILCQKEDEKLVTSLADNVKKLSQCAKKARLAMWCDLTLTKAMAGDTLQKCEAPKPAAATVKQEPVVEPPKTPTTSESQEPSKKPAEASKAPAPQAATSATAPANPTDPQPPKPAPHVPYNNIRNGKNINNNHHYYPRSGGMQYIHYDRNRFHPSFGMDMHHHGKQQGNNGMPPHRGRHFAKANHNNNYLSTAPIK